MSSYTLGIDTSNYATSLAVFDTAGEVVCAKKRFLPVKEGQLGLRQSDALFHHTAALPEMLKELSGEFDLTKISAVGVSEKPRPVEGSYMPCFLAGVSAAEAFALARGIPLVRTTHQQGHAAAALFAAKGEESLGGYDIFITRYDTEEGNYLKPDNMGFPFNSPFNDYMYAIDDFNDLGWFASDRYQPEGKICVYVFAPNSSKQVYDYDSTDPGLLTNIAMLNGIRHTWNDADKVRLAKQQLAQVMYGEDESRKKGDFRFVVNDNDIYHNLDDFRSAEARQKYQQLQQKEKDLEAISELLVQSRSKYASGSLEMKKELTPGILDREKRVKELHKEIEVLTLDIRNTEIKTLKNL